MKTIADTRQVGAAVDYVNTMYSYPKEARLACAVRELRGLSKASPDSDVNFG